MMKVIIMITIIIIMIMIIIIKIIKLSNILPSNSPLLAFQNILPTHFVFARMTILISREYVTWSSPSILDG